MFPEGITVNIDASSQAEIFEKCARQPYLWISSAEVLKDSADLVLARFRTALERAAPEREDTKIDLGISLFPVYMMLVGLAVENLLKGVLISKDHSLVEGGRLKKWGGSGHDLTKLASDARLPLTNEEKELLARVAEFVRWAGKYPLPYSSRVQAPYPIPIDGYDDLARWEVSDPPRIDDLFLKFRHLLKESKGGASH